MGTSRTNESSPRRDSQYARRVALDAARQALDEFSASPARNEMLRATVREAAQEVLKNTLEKLGIDTEHPEETRKDMIHLRTWRELIEFMKKEGIGSAVKWFTLSALAALALGVTIIFGRGAAH